MNMQSNDKNTLAESSIRIAQHASLGTLDALRESVANFFPLAVGEYSAMPIQNYRDIVSTAQDALSGADFVRRIVQEMKADLDEYLQGERFLVQSNLYLRATRPVASQATEAVGWHRETFYGPNMGKAVNVWTPISGVTAANTIQYVPMSQLIPDEDIQVNRVDDEVTTRFSTGHKIGFVYAPKIIVGGVDLANAVPMNVPAGYSGIFSGNLIHGAGTNRAEAIRFSMDFRILPVSAWSPSQNKDRHFSSGKAYFEEL